ncbi:MAG: hypothetical protein U5Q03_15775 [Bacteroidota bacterium]|nr:hypothetical protein [Bacteroidota bacterium]
MKNITALLSFLILMTSTMLCAQAPLAFDKVQFNAGFGISDRGVPVYAGLDYGLTELISFGGEVQYSSFRESWQGEDWKHSSFLVAMNSNCHFDELLNISSVYNVYAGIALGFAMVASQPEKEEVVADYEGDQHSSLYYSVNLGNRYFFTEHIAANLQLGFGTTMTGRFGLSWLF